MKTILITLCTFLMLNQVKAQFLGGFFSQKKTQKEYLMQQIAALKVYKGYLEKGYDIAKGGLNTISQIKNGDFNLHHLFFSSLKSVNPRIKKYAKVGQIINMNIRMMTYIKGIKEMGKSELWTVDETKYLLPISARLMDNLISMLSELSDIITDNQLEMKDDERIERIDTLYLQSVNHYVFLNKVKKDMSLMLHQKEMEKADILLSRTINGISIK